MSKADACRSRRAAPQIPALLAGPLTRRRKGGKNGRATALWLRTFLSGIIGSDGRPLVRRTGLVPSGALPFVHA